VFHEGQIEDPLEIEPIELSRARFVDNRRRLGGEGRKFDRRVQFDSAQANDSDRMARKK